MHQCACSAVSTWFVQAHATHAHRAEAPPAAADVKYKLHTDQDLFDRAYGYIVQYY